MRSPEHCLRLGRCQGPPHEKEVKQHEIVLSFKVSLLEMEETSQRVTEEGSLSQDGHMCNRCCMYETKHQNHSLQIALLEYLIQKQWCNISEVCGSRRTTRVFKNKKKKRRKGRNINPRNTRERGSSLSRRVQTTWSAAETVTKRDFISLFALKEACADTKLHTCWNIAVMWSASISLLSLSYTHTLTLTHTHTLCCAVLSALPWQPGARCWWISQIFHLFIFRLHYSFILPHTCASSPHVCTHACSPRHTRKRLVWFWSSKPKSEGRKGAIIFSLPTRHSFVKWKAAHTN